MSALHTALVSMLSLTLAAPAVGLAASKVVGLKVTPVSTVQDTVTFDVTLYADGDAPAPQIPLRVPLTVSNFGSWSSSWTAQTQYVYGSYGNYSTVTLTFDYARRSNNYSYQNINPNPQAIAFGDGAGVLSADLPLASASAGPGGSHVYKGSFSHTYPGPGNYTVVATAGPRGESGAPGHGYAEEGNPAYTPIAGEADIGTLFVNHRSTVGVQYYNGRWGTSQFNYYGGGWTSGYSNTVKGINAQAQLQLGESTPCPDADADGVCDGQDNCPRDFNPDQIDFDGDGYGDVCPPAPGGCESRSGLPLGALLLLGFGWRRRSPRQMRG